MIGTTKLVMESLPNLLCDMVCALQNGKTVLLFAAANANPEIVQQLLRVGADHKASDMVRARY